MLQHGRRVRLCCPHRSPVGTEGNVDGFASRSLFLRAASASRMRLMRIWWKFLGGH